MSNSFGALCFFLRRVFLHCVFLHCAFLRCVSRFSPAFLFVNSPICCCSFPLPSITIWVETRAKSEKSAKICTIFFWYALFCFLRWAKYHKNRLPKRINLMRVYHSPLLRNRPFSEIAPSPKTYKSTHIRVLRTRVRAFQQRCWFFAVTSVTLSSIFPPFFLPPFALSSLHFFRSDIDPQTTRCFQQNDTLFFIKRHVVFYKTTRCFSSNITSFFLKPHVFLPFIWTHIAHISKWML